MQKDKLGVAIETIMKGFSSVNEKYKDTFIDLERQKLIAKKLELNKLEFENVQCEERQHQFNMMKMLIGATGPRPAAQPAHSVAQPADSMSCDHAVPFSPSAQQSQNEKSQSLRDENLSFSMSVNYIYYDL